MESKVPLKTSLYWGQLVKENITLLQIDGRIIKQLDYFTYIGITVSIDGGAIKNINVRIHKAKYVFTCRYKIRKGSNIETTPTSEFLLLVLNQSRSQYNALAQ